MLACAVLNDEPFMLSNATDTDPATPSIGTKIKMVFKPAVGGSRGVRRSARAAWRQ